MNVLLRTLPRPTERVDPRQAEPYFLDWHGSNHHTWHPRRLQRRPSGRGLRAYLANEFFEHILEHDDAEHLAAMIGNTRDVRPT